MRIQIIILLILLISIMATYILHRIFKNKRFVKYIPHPCYYCLLWFITL